ncbi:uncharacterized protein LOC135503466 [Lineus longissimus]|uniref:uncharacterized protein LOC135503466 n=1 Tax=Lineus longissimus TaxID=88925 RepID=UPI00315C6EC6
MGALERVVCCCQKCQNIKLKIRALNQAATATGHREAKIQEDDLAQISKITLCKESDSNRPAAKCINRECTVCGIKKISEHFREMKTNNGNKTVKYEIWLRVKKTKDVKGVKKEITVTEPVTKEATVGELIDLLEQGMKIIRAPTKTKCKSGHWGDKPQATIHPVMAFINKGNDHRPFTHKAALIFISDEKKHDADAVATYMSIAYPYLRKEYGVTHVEEFSDCCAAQYRCGKSFADFSFYEHDFAVSVQHNYFESSHGKSSADGLGAVVKHRATVAVTRRQATIRNAEELYQFCVTNFSDVGQSCFPAERKKYTSSARKFFYVKKEDKEHQRPSRAVKSVPGTMKIHCLKPTGQPYQIETRILLCFCQTCAINPAVGVCDNREYVGEWKKTRLHLLEPKKDKVNKGKHPQKEQQHSSSDRAPLANTDGESNDETDGVCRIGDYVVVKLGTTSGKTKLYCAVIQNVHEGTKTCDIVYLKSHGRSYFTLDEMDIDTVGFECIVTSLKQPQVNKRDQYFFKVPSDIRLE